MVCKHPAAGRRGKTWSGAAAAAAAVAGSMLVVTAESMGGVMAVSLRRREKRPAHRNLADPAVRRVHVEAEALYPHPVLVHPHHRHDLAAVLRSRGPNTNTGTSVRGLQR